jgi:hypothetical protein
LGLLLLVLELGLLRILLLQKILLGSQHLLFTRGEERVQVREQSLVAVAAPGVIQPLSYLHQKHEHTIEKSRDKECVEPVFF